MKDRELPKLTPAEFEIMNVVWQEKELSTSEIVRMVNAGKSKKLKRTTIQVQVNRLEEKGWLTHRQDGNRFFFQATVPRKQASAAIALDVKERVFGGSCVELVKSLFSHSEISHDEISKLRKIIDNYEKGE